MKITKFRVNGQEAPIAESALDGQLLLPPVIVTTDIENFTWSGATWEEFYAAYFRNAAGVRITDGNGGYRTFWASGEGTRFDDEANGYIKVLMFLISLNSQLFLAENGMIDILTNTGISPGPIIPPPSENPVT